MARWLTPISTSITPGTASSRLQTRHVESAIVRRHLSVTGKDDVGCVGTGTHRPEVSILLKTRCGNDPAAVDHVPVADQPGILDRQRQRVADPVALFVDRGGE